MPTRLQIAPFYQNDGFSCHHHLCKEKFILKFNFFNVDDNKTSKATKKTKEGKNYN